MSCQKNYSNLDNYNIMQPGYIQLPSPMITINPTFGLNGNYELYHGTCPTGNNYFTVCAAYRNTCGPGNSKCRPEIPGGKPVVPTFDPQNCCNIDKNHPDTGYYCKDSSSSFKMNGQGYSCASQSDYNNASPGTCTQVTNCSPSNN